jgi:hypothetical protein
MAWPSNSKRGQASNHAATECTTKAHKTHPNVPVVRSTIENPFAVSDKRSVPDVTFTTPAKGNYRKTVNNQSASGDAVKEQHH